MTRLVLRRGTVASVEQTGAVVEFTVEIDGERRPAIAYAALTGPVEVGDDVVVNTAAAELGLGSGGFDLLHVNLTRGLGGVGETGAHVMKLNYTSLQHAVHPIEESAPELAGGGGPVAVISLHGQLPCVAWAAAQAAQGARIGFVQTAGGALPGQLSRVVSELRERGMLAAHVTAGPAFGGEREAISVPGALHAGFAADGWDAAIAGPGPGILGSATALGHGGLAALDTAHGALALGCPTLIVPRMSQGDPRPRHQGLSHHTATVLEMLLRPVTVAVPDGEAAGVRRSVGEEHRVLEVNVDLDGYARSGLPARTMGRDIADDELFFKAALAGGTALAKEIHGA
ncbi:MAG: DUF3866 family protein [Thermoleophilaceae bacterium]